MTAISKQDHVIMQVVSSRREPQLILESQFRPSQGNYVIEVHHQARHGPHSCFCTELVDYIFSRIVQKRDDHSFSHLRCTCWLPDKFLGITSREGHTLLVVRT